MATRTDSVHDCPSEACSGVDLYRVLAYAFGPPTRERWAWLSGVEFVSALEGVWNSLKPDEPFPGFEPFVSPEEYEAAYIALFDIGMPEPPVPLVESAHHKAIPAQQIALEVMDFYDVLGLQHDRGGFPPDHLVPQLEFLAAVRYAAESTTDGSNRASLARLEGDFLERHLFSWLPAAEGKLQKIDPSVFSVLLRLLDVFVRTRVERHSAIPS